jgi:tetratricopeptide (TPR) repeat protein
MISPVRRTLDRALSDIRAGAVEAGVAMLRSALRDGDDPAVRNALGVVLTDHGAGHEAVDVLAPLAQAPNAHATAWLNYGNALVAAGRVDDALPWLQRAANIEASAADIWYSLGRAQHLAGWLHEADASYARATACDPSHVLAWANRSATAFFLGRRADALAHADRAVALDPTYDGAHFNRAIALLAARRWHEGWQAYAWRWHTPMLAPQRRQWPSPEWNGEPLPGTLLVFAEQGLGDTIQGARWLAKAQRRASRVVLWCAEPLVRWCAASGLADSVVRFADAMPAHDAHVALWSLPHVMSLDTDVAVHGDGGAYYHADQPPTPVAAGRTTLRVGIAWAGSATHINDRHRSVPMHALAPLWRVPGITWVSLQVDQPGALANAVCDVGAVSTVDEPAPALRDFADTANALAQCDLVIAVDSAVAHAAGALGVPTWLLLPRVGLDWRWAETPGATPWYASVTTWRAAAGETWDALLAEVAQRLQRAAAQHLAARGAAYARAEQWLLACETLQHAAAADASHAAVQVNLATAALAVRRFDAAYAAACHAVTLAPQLPDAWCRMANVHTAVGHDAEAVRAAGKARALAPGDPVAIATHARALERADQLGASLAAWDAVLDESPDDVRAHYNRSLVLLKAGRWAEGWPAYEWRWATDPYRNWRTAWPALPVWDGVVRPGMHVVVRHEQGMGDTIMAARWWPALVARGMHVTAQVPAPLVRLLDGQFPGVEIRDVRDAVTADVMVSALSVPSRLGLGAPSGAPYLVADPARVAAVREQLARAPRPWRGLVWAGEPAHPFDHLRSRPFAHFDALRASQPGTWISLQVGPRREELRNAPSVVDAGAHVRDFADTAAWLAVLDELVAVDTSVAHLAGALGVATLLLLPACADWRWGVSGDRTGWYDRMRLMRAPRPGEDKTA